jgi:hypothetical protein
MLEYLWLIPMLPLAGSFTIGLAGLVTLRRSGRKLNKRIVSTIALLSVGLALVLSIAVVYQAFVVEGREVVTQDLFTWLKAGELPLSNGTLARFEVPWGVQLDPLSAVMILVVTGVGFLIHVYSTGYMWDDTGYYRFFSYLNLFMFAMLTLVLANNYLMMFVGWEALFVPAHRVLLRQEECGGRWQEGIRSEPDRGRGIPARNDADIRPLRFAPVRRSVQPGRRASRAGRARIPFLGHALPVHWGDRQERSDTAVCLVA